MESFIIGLRKITGYLTKTVVYSFDDSYFSIPAYAVVSLAVGNGDYHSNFVEIFVLFSVAGECCEEIMDIQKRT